jgi:hypothetical protein
VTGRGVRPRLAFWLLPLPALVVLLVLVAPPVLSLARWGAWLYLLICLTPMVALAVLGAFLYALRHGRREPRTALLPLVACAGGAWLIFSGTAGGAAVRADFALNRGLREEIVALARSDQLDPAGQGAAPPRSYVALMPRRYRSAAPSGRVFVERTADAVYVLFPRDSAGVDMFPRGFAGVDSYTGFLYRSDDAAAPPDDRASYRAWWLLPQHAPLGLTPIEQMAPHWFYVRHD